MPLSFAAKRKMDIDAWVIHYVMGGKAGDEVYSSYDEHFTVAAWCAMPSRVYACHLKGDALFYSLRTWARNNHSGRVNLLLCEVPLQDYLISR